MVGGRQQPRTLLEQLIRQREATYEEQVRDFERLARHLEEPATLTVRHLQRLASGERSGDRANPSTRRVMREFYGHPLNVLLGPPSGHDGVAPAPASIPPSGVVAVTSHKFIPLYIGADTAAGIAAGEPWSDGTCDWLPTRVAEFPSELGLCTVTVFGFGVLVAHIVEQRRFGSLAELAVWRDRSYPPSREHVFRLLHDRWPQITATPEYVLSTYWVTDPPWSDEALDTALRILCAPASLLERRDGLTDDEMLGTAKVAEQVRFRDGFAHPEIEQFGMTGVSVGYASWSGVSYLPLSPTHAVTCEELASFETVVQALWCYTNMIATVIEDGQDPVLPDPYRWRFLRGCHSRLTTARPCETGQLRVMKDAILGTSRLPAQLLDAHSSLRDLDYPAGRR
jgi:hypothetical protein